MSAHPAHCKFCGCNVTCHIDDDCPEVNAANWLPLAACNRCADFRMTLLKIGDNIHHVLGKLHDMQASKNKGAAEAAAREKLTEITKRLMRVLCDFYRVQNYWQPECVDELIDHPEKYRFLISFMRSTVENHAKKARAI